MAEVMKDSKTRWLGQIPVDWDMVRVKDCFIRKNRKANQKDPIILSLARSGVKVRDISSNEGQLAADYTNYNPVTKEDILINPMDLVSGDNCNISKVEGVISPAYINLRYKKGINPRFYNYYFKLQYWLGAFFAHGFGVSFDNRWTLSYETLSKYPLVLPPSDEQDKIADFLDEKCAEIDRLSEDIQKQINTLEEYKKTIIKGVFDSNMEKYPYVKAKIGDLSYFATKQTGFDYSKTISPSLVGEDGDNVIPYLQTRHFKDNYFNFNTQYYIPKAIARFFPRIILKEKCLLLSIVGASIGNVAVYPGNRTAFLGGAICKVSLKDASLYDYIKHFMMSIYGQDQISIKINSSAQGTITIEDVRHFRVPIFNDKDVMKNITEKINNFAENHDKIIIEKQKQLEQLVSYKKSLIYEYVTGKKRVA